MKFLNGNLLIEYDQQLSTTFSLMGKWGDSVIDLIESIDKNFS